jgi:hypothetical protein
MIDPADSRTKPLPVTVPCPTRVTFASDSRLYCIILDQDLFDQWTVIQSWGGKHNQRGGGKSIAVESFERGMTLIESIAKRRKARGYERLR